MTDDEVIALVQAGFFAPAGAMRPVAMTKAQMKTRNGVLESAFPAKAWDSPEAVVAWLKEVPTSTGD